MPTTVNSSARYAKTMAFIGIWQVGVTAEWCRMLLAYPLFATFLLAGGRPGGGCSVSSWTT
jgi:hypothetical protein